MHMRAHLRNQLDIGPDRVAKVHLPGEGILDDLSRRARLSPLKPYTSKASDSSTPSRNKNAQPSKPESPKPKDIQTFKPPKPLPWKWPRPRPALCWGGRGFPPLLPFLCGRDIRTNRAEILQGDPGSSCRNLGFQGRWSLQNNF